MFGATQSTVEEEAGCGERVFMPGQTHISIEEEHPGVEDDEARKQQRAAAADDDDMNDLSPVQPAHDLDMNNGQLPVNNNSNCIGQLRPITTSPHYL